MLTLIRNLFLLCFEKFRIAQGLFSAKIMDIEKILEEFYVVIVVSCTSTLSVTCEPSSWPGSRPEVTEGRRVEAVSAKQIA